MTSLMSEKINLLDLFHEKHKISYCPTGSRPRRPRFNPPKYCRKFDLLHSHVVKFCLVPLGSRVQCVARAVNTDRDPGLEIFSEPVTISRTDGLCEPRIMDSVGAEPFAARLRYTGQCACVLESAFPDPSSLSTYLDRMTGLTSHCVTMHMVSSDGY